VLPGTVLPGTPNRIHNFHNSTPNLTSNPNPNPNPNPAPAPAPNPSPNPNPNPNPNPTKVAALCSQLPHILDVNPALKEATEYTSPHELWRGTVLGLVFDTLISSIDAKLEGKLKPSRLLYVTEKIMKPLMNFRPLLMIGSAGPEHYP
jgi:hypothetical protein